MSRAVKYKNNDYLDTRGIVHNKVELKTILQRITESSVGEYILWEGEKLITENGTYQYFATTYNTLENLLSVFPIKEGFERTYMLKLDYTDNLTTQHIHIKITNYANTITVTEKLFPYTWGETDSGSRRSQTMSITTDGLNQHNKLYITPSFGTGATVRIYKLSLLVYDKL